MTDDSRQAVTMAMDPELSLNRAASTDVTVTGNDPDRVCATKDVRG